MKIKIISTRSLDMNKSPYAVEFVVAFLARSELCLCRIRFIKQNYVDLTFALNHKEITTAHTQWLIKIIIYKNS